MAEGAQVIQFPIVQQKRTCWDCCWHVESSDKSGLWSTCTLFVEEIHDERTAESCDGWEV